MTGWQQAKSLRIPSRQSGPPVLWVRELGQGYSGFAVADGRAYTQAQSLYQQSLFCLDAKTGETLWSYNYAWPYDGGGLYPGPRSTPTVQGGRVYFCSPQGIVLCVSADEGKLLWSVNFNEQFGGRGTEFGYSASPLVIDGLVILPVGGEQAGIIALKAVDGSLALESRLAAGKLCHAPPDYLEAGFINRRSHAEFAGLRSSDHRGTMVGASALQRL